MIDLRSEQVIEHVHGGGEQHALIGLAGAPADDFGEEGFAHAGIADKTHAGTFGEELQIEQSQNARLELHAALVMFEVKAVDGVLRCRRESRKRRSMERPLRASSSQVDERFQGFSDAKVSGRGVSDRLIQLAGS